MTKLASCDNVSHSENLTESFRRLNLGTQQEGERWFRENRKVGFWQIFLKAKLDFFCAYFLKGGFTKGYSGFIQSIHCALYQLLSYAKYWELTERTRGKM